MKSVSKIENLFTVINETAELIAKDCHLSYIEAVALTGENIFQQSILLENLSETTKKNLKRKYETINIDTFEKEDIRKAFQLTILKGLKEGAHPNHQMTPDSIGLFMGYLVNKFLGEKKELSILDPAIGTGNLLTTILNHVPLEGVRSFGVEVDDLLIKLAYISANLQEHSLELFNQDSLQRLLIDPVDMVVCDLPVGYYPNDIEAAKYQLKANEGHSYSHHLLIEQSINHTKENGYLFFIVPNSLFDTVEAPSLNQYLKEVAVIQCFIQLPLSLFKDDKHGKSILILQKKGKEAKPPKQAMLVEMPNFSNKSAMATIMGQMDQWFKDNK